MSNIIDKVYDNTKDGVPNYSIDLIDGTRLYYRGVVMNPMPNSGDAINYTVVNTKTSANGNQYTNIKDVSVAYNPDGQNDAPSNNAPQSLGNVVSNANFTPSKPMGNKTFLHHASVDDYYRAASCIAGHVQNIHVKTYVNI